MDKLFVIDGNSLMFRAYYALQAPMCNSEGFPTGAIYGFLNMLLKLLSMEPTHMAVAFDCAKPTFRHESYDGYKQGRRQTPDDLILQMPVLQRVLREMGLCVLTKEGYEADDILGTVSRMGEEQGAEVLLVTGDRDALQLIGPSTHVLLTKKGITDTVEMTEEALQEQFHLTPAKMVDLKALMGDASDNIPGIPGVGEKTALKLLDTYGSLDGVLAAAEGITGKLGEKVRAGADSARLSFMLGTILRTVPLELAWEQLQIRPERFSGALDSLKSLELKTVVARLPGGAAGKEEKKENVPLTKETVTSMAEMDAILSRHTEKKRVAISLENGFSLAFDGEHSYMLQEQGDLFTPGLEAKEVLQALLTKEILTFDAKKLLHLAGENESRLTVAFDAEIADYLLSANKPAATLSELAEKRLQPKTGEAAVLFRLEPVLTAEIKALGMEKLFYETEMPLIRVLFGMEKEGFLIDATVLRELKKRFSERQAAEEEQIYTLAGEKFNILSPKQLSSVLFDANKLALPAGKKTKSGYSTDSSTLEAIELLHPIVPLIMDYRFVSKLNATFVEGLLAATDAGGRVHSTFNQCVTATGRISSTEPNLQNIPTRTKEGKEIRRAFIAKPGSVLVGGDYSQIELRLLAHYCGDERLIAGFNSGADIHTLTASEVFHVAPEEVTKEQRSAAKAVNFGIIYGISDFGLARNLNIPVRAAAGYIQSYLERYPKIQTYMQEAVRLAKARGYAETLWGRRRPVPELSSGNYNTRSFGERVAMNMPIQGSAADLIKIAMVRVNDALREKKLAARLILQIHDELIIEAPAEEQETVRALLKDCMENAAELKVKLVAEVSVAQNWAEAK